MTRGHVRRFAGAASQTPSPTVKYFSAAHFCMIFRASGLGGEFPFPFTLLHEIQQAIR